jgi:hypothetical protein
MHTSPSLREAVASAPAILPGAPKRALRVASFWPCSRRRQAQGRMPKPLSATGFGRPYSRSSGRSPEGPRRGALLEPQGAKTHSNRADDAERPPSPAQLLYVHVPRGGILMEGGKPVGKRLTWPAKEAASDHSHVGRMLRLMSLALDIVETMLGGNKPDGLNLTKLHKGLPERWQEQRRRWSQGLLLRMPGGHGTSGLPGRWRG